MNTAMSFIQKKNNTIMVPPPRTNKRVTVYLLFTDLENLSLFSQEVLGIGLGDYYHGENLVTCNENVDYVFVPSKLESCCDKSRKVIDSKESIVVSFSSKDNLFCIFKNTNPSNVVYAKGYEELFVELNKLHF